MELLDPADPTNPNVLRTFHPGDAPLQPDVLPKNGLRRWLGCAVVSAGWTAARAGFGQRAVRASRPTQEIKFTVVIDLRF